MTLRLNVWRKLFVVIKPKLRTVPARTLSAARSHQYITKSAVSGTSRDGLAQRVRSRKHKATPQVRVKRLVCPLPSGVSITLAGDELSLDESIEALGEAIREMKRARELGYTARTFAAAMKDKAKKESHEPAAT